MVRISDLRLGRAYDFEGTLEDGSHPDYVEAGHGEWTGWLLGMTPNEDEFTWTCFFKDNEGCNLYFSVGTDYNDFFQRPEPQRTGRDLSDMLSWVCNLDEESSDEEEEDGEGEGEGENGGNGENENWSGGRRKRRRQRKSSRKQRRTSRKSKKTRRSHRQ